MFFEYHDCKYNINIIRKNNKNTYIRFKDNEIIVTTNYLVSDKKIDRLIKDNRVFNEKQIECLLRFKWWEKDSNWIKNNSALFNDIEKFMSVIDNDYKENN